MVSVAGLDCGFMICMAPDLVCFVFFCFFSPKKSEMREDTGPRGGGRGYEDYDDGSSL